MDYLRDERGIVGGQESLFMGALLDISRGVARVGDVKYPRQRLSRACRRMGLPVPNHIVSFARLLTAHWIMRFGNEPAKVAARLVDFPDPYTFSTLFLRLTDLRPSAARNMSAHMVIDAWIVRERKRGAFR